jgi:hypothetical protein
LRPHPTFSAFEFSHSLVNITQWLTAKASSGGPHDTATGRLRRRREKSSIEELIRLNVGRHQPLWRIRFMMAALYRSIRAGFLRRGAGTQAASLTDCSRFNCAAVTR